MDGTRQQAYDRGHTIFSPDGRLYQVEYAREAVERGSPAVGVRTGDGIVLAARKRLRSPLLEPETVAKIHRVDDHLAVAAAGHAADARQLVDRARIASQRHRLRYGEPIPVESATTALADHVQENTQTGGSRPYGAALLIAGTDAGSEGDERFGLFEVDPSGTPYGWRAVAIGDGASAVRQYFEDELSTADATDLSLDRGVELALDGVTTADDTDPDPEAIDCWTIGPGATIDSRSTGEIASALDAAS